MGWFGRPDLLAAAAAIAVGDLYSASTAVRVPVTSILSGSTIIADWTVIGPVDARGPMEFGKDQALAGFLDELSPAHIEATVRQLSAAPAARALYREIHGLAMGSGCGN